VIDFLVKSSDQKSSCTLPKDLHHVESCYSLETETNIKRCQVKAAEEFALGGNAATEGT